MLNPETISHPFTKSLLIFKVPFFAFLQNIFVISNDSFLLELKFADLSFEGIRGAAHAIAESSIANVKVGQRRSLDFGNSLFELAAENDQSTPRSQHHSYDGSINHYFADFNDDLSIPRSVIVVVVCLVLIFHSLVNRKFFLLVNLLDPFMIKRGHQPISMSPLSLKMISRIWRKPQNSFTSKHNDNRKGTKHPRLWIWFLLGI